MNFLTNDFWMSMINIVSYIKDKGVDKEEYTPALDRENYPQAER